MRDAIKDVVRIYMNYAGTSVMPVLSFVALVCLAQSEKKEANRIVLLYGNICVLLVVFNPLLYFLYSRFIDAATYWRMWWMLPISIILAYVWTQLTGKWQIQGLLVGILVIVIGGEFIYTGPTNGERGVAENPYKIPQYVIEILDEMKSTAEEEPIRAAFPAAMLPYVRQYDPDILMPYGREMLDPNWNEGQSGFFLEMNSGTINFAVLADKCRYNDTRFIVVDKNMNFANEPKDYGFSLFYMSETYWVYEYEL